jgi:hypothetical protein
VDGRVFISASSKDRRIAYAICNAIEQRGVPCWLADRDVGPGENYQAAIVDAVASARAMILIFTSNASDSDEVKKELALASQYRVAVIPVRAEEIEPTGAFAYEFAIRQWIDLFADWERGIERLGSLLPTLRSRKAAGTKAAPDAVANSRANPNSVWSPELPRRQVAPRSRVSVILAAVAATTIVLLATGALAIYGYRFYIGMAECPLASVWSQEIKEMGRSVWVISADGRAQETGLGNVAGTATISGRTLTIHWIGGGGYTGEYSVQLAPDCQSGQGLVRWNKLPPGMTRLEAATFFARLPGR